jgi:hypothetical protein
VGKLNWDHAMGEVYVGVAEAAGVNFDNDLIGAGLGDLPLPYFPLAVYTGNDCCFHERIPRNFYDCKVGCGSLGWDAEMAAGFAVQQAATVDLVGWLHPSGKRELVDLRSTWTAGSFAPSLSKGRPSHIALVKRKIC